MHVYQHTALSMEAMARVSVAGVTE